MVGWYARFIARNSEIKAPFTKSLKKTEEWKWEEEQQTAFERLKSALTSALYIEGYRFVEITDHSALKWLRNLKDPNGRLARWALEMQQWNFVIEHREGALHHLPDALSRVFTDEDGEVRECSSAEITNKCKNVQQEAPIIALDSVENKVTSVENLPPPGLNSSESNLVATIDDVWDDIVATIAENSDAPVVVPTAEDGEISKRVGATVELVEPEVIAPLPNDHASPGDGQRDEPEDESTSEQPRKQAQEQLHEPMQKQPQGPVQVPLQRQQLELQPRQKLMEANSDQELVFKKRKRGCRGGRKKKPSSNRQLTVDDVELSFDIPPRDDEEAGPPNRRQANVSSDFRKNDQVK
ncbi:unnamed protein product, partial [Trichogramma brassicae]